MPRKDFTTVEIGPHASAACHASSWRMSGVAILFVYWAALAIGTHIPRVPEVLNFHTLWDKLMHFSGFCGLAYLMAFAWQLCRTLNYPLTWRHFATIVIVISVYGGVDEVTQRLVGRNGELADWFADTLGATCGVIAFAMSMLVARWLLRSKSAVR